MAVTRARAALEVRLLFRPHIRELLSQEGQLSGRPGSDAHHTLNAAQRTALVSLGYNRNADLDGESPSRDANYSAVASERPRDEG